MVDQGRGLPVASANYNQYPAPLAKYEDVVANRHLFMTTLEKLHATMGTKFMIPIIGGRDLDLHKLFVEVTSRGGIEKILAEKRWKDVTATFSFPSTATNASFVLRKYYHSLLLNYEQIYYFKANGVLQNDHATPVLHGLTKTSTAPSPDQPANVQQPSVNTTEFVSGVPRAPSVGFPVVGVIDGKFDSGYLVTVTIGKEKLKGVLYQTPANINQMVQASGVKTDRTPATPSVHRKRRRRRRKSEMRKRDPTHPKPNRSGYNFFFSEQHAKLKPLHPGRDREISRMIGDLWNKLKDDEKSVYQEKAVKDKERYRIEMEDYKERLRENQVISDAIPIRQRFPVLDVEMVDTNTKDETEKDSPESNCSKSETEDEEDDNEDDDDEEDDDDMVDNDDEEFSDAETMAVMGDTTVESGNARTSETSAAIAEDFQVVTGVEKTVFEDSEGGLEAGNSRHRDTKQDSAPDVQHENSTTPMT